MKFLIVEDYLVQAESLRDVLALLGHRAYLAATAEAAKGVAEVHPPDAVVLDLLIPGGGVSFFRWLRAQPNLSGIPVVVATGLPPEEAADLDGLEPYEFLMKPCEPDELLAAVEAMLAREKRGGA